MDWSYIAGFTDGEGCIHYNRKRNQWHIVISQIVRDSHVLLDLQNFLKELGIRSDLSYRPTTKPRHHDIWTIRISGAKHVFKFIQGILPYTIVKKAVAEKALEFNAGVLHRIKERQEQQANGIQLAMIDYAAGYSMYYCTKKYRISNATMIKYFDKFGVKRRNQAEGIAQYWGLSVSQLKRKSHRH